jgi:tRNA(Ile)-lysidine synthase
VGVTRRAPMDDAGPLSAAAFAELMRAAGPFQKSPRIAVACSGGSDSMALTLLAADWVKRRRGEIVALIVDHRLRTESTAEARRVGAWLDQRGIPHRTLRWRSDKPTANVAAAAREARYRLLLDWCRRNRVGDLLAAHQQEDQAETFLLRLARGSGIDGLTAMALIATVDGIRLLRPLLDVPRARLRATLRRRKQEWVDDPSNVDPAYARSRMRALLPSLADEGLTVPRLAATAQRFARVRAVLEAATDELIAATAVLDLAGFCRLDGARLGAAPEEIALRALSRILMTIGGAALPPRLARTERLLAEIASSPTKGRTLAGCRLLPQGGRLLVCREPAAVAGPLPLRAGRMERWDGRFVVVVEGRGAKSNLRVAALGAQGWSAIVARLPVLRAISLPTPVRPSLPALWHLDEVLAVPHLHYVRDQRGPQMTAEFRPIRPLFVRQFAAERQPRPGSLDLPPDAEAS